MDDHFRALGADQERVGLPASGPARQAASRLPGAAISLEHSYRRLLFLYPARYRRIHEEEMLAVLMTTPSAGKRRPGLAEAADLAWGALRVRLQPQRDGGEPVWRDALAALSVILPLVMLAVFAGQLTGQWQASSKSVLDIGFPLWMIRQIAAPILLVVLVLLRRRRAAIVVSVALFLWLAQLNEGLTLLWATGDAYLLVPLALEVIALAASAGPQRGRQLLTWKHGALAVVAALAASLPGSAVPLAVIAVAGGAVMVLCSSLARWLIVLLAAAAWPFFIVVADPSGDPLVPFLPSEFGVVSETYLVPAVLLAWFAVSALRESRRLARPAPASR
jgi:hypothetical protein